jgi:hypothetical protein
MRARGCRPADEVLPAFMTGWAKEAIGTATALSARLAHSAPHLARSEWVEPPQATQVAGPRLGFPLALRGATRLARPRVALVGYVDGTGAERAGEPVRG